MNCVAKMMLGSDAEMQIQDLFDLILLGEDVYLAVNEAKSFKVECGELGKRVNRLLEMLNNLFCFITSAPTSLYLRPVNCMVEKLKCYFKEAQAILDKCKHRNLLCRLFTSCNEADFRQLFHDLDASISDMEWLVSVFVPQSRARGSTANKMSPTVLAWSCIATVEMGPELEDRVRAAEFLASLAQEKDEYKNIIFEEGGVPPLQNLLKETISLVAQVAAANALCLLANEEERKRIIMKEMISTIINRLSRTSPIWDQMQAANLVASIVEHNPELKEYDLIRENVIWRLVTLLSSEQSTQKLRISCSKALWKLAQRSVSNCRTLTETKGMLCLAKLVETEQDELKFNCLMIVREITAIAESNNNFRHSTFKRTSPAAKAVVDELLKVIKEFDDAKLRIPAIRSIGSLARSFSAKESRVISPLVARLGNTDQEVAMEAAVALQKFVCIHNHLCLEHSKSIIEFDGVPSLMKLLISGDKKSQPHGLALICCLAQHDVNSNFLIKAGALTALQTTGCKVAKEHPELEELVSHAIFKLESNHNHTDKQEQLDSSPGVKQKITEQSKAVVDSLRRQLKLPFKWLTVCLPRLVNLQDDHKTSPMVMRCKRRILGALAPFKTKRIRHFLKAKCVELALISMDYLGERLVIKEIAGKLKLEVKNFVKSFEKKENRRQFGYVIHKFCENAILLVHIAC